MRWLNARLKSFSHAGRGLRVLLGQSNARIHLIVAQNPVLLDDAAGLLRAGGLESVAVPVLLIDGADSPPVIAAVHDALAARLPAAARLSVAGAAHMVSITHASAVAVAVQAHLDAC